MAVLTDPIADMLTRIRNGCIARKQTVEIPASNLKVKIAELLKAEGFLNQVEVSGVKDKRTLKVTIRYRSPKEPMIKEIHRVSKPGCRVFVTSQELAEMRNPILTTVLSTSKGIMTGRAAREANVGGEIMLKVH